MGDDKSTDIGKVWWFWFTTNAFAVDKRLRQIFRILPHDPRCKFCNAPFQGVGGISVRGLFGKQRSVMNPRFCNLCEAASREFPGGAEVDMSMLFADVRGSTALSEKMSPTEFSRLINRFYTASTKVIIDEDGLVEKLAGDAVAAFWGAGFAGPNFGDVSAAGWRRLWRCRRPPEFTARRAAGHQSRGAFGSRRFLALDYPGIPRHADARDTLSGSDHRPGIKCQISLQYC